MKHLLLLSLAGALTMQAATINIYSDLVSETNNRDGSNDFITPHPVWQPNFTDAKWISYRANSGAGGGDVAEPNQGDINGTPSAIFYETFYTASAGTGSITVWADDTARVKLNGFTLFAANAVQDGACASGPIACEPAEGQLINFAFAGAGLQTLSFEVYQRGGGPMGLLYTGYAEFRDIVEGGNEVPEPSTYALMGAGLIGFGLYRRRRA